ncbi:MAG: YraN family protein [Clostridia bacterium]|nr:YraN family protein [Clostridia bacterium]
MMKNTLFFGNVGEKAACKYLKKNKYKILACNYRKPYGEIDIIVQKGETVVFVEVKTRKGTEFGLACEAVTASKQKRLVQTAYSFIEENNLDLNYRFDVIEVYHENGKAKTINHIENAFLVEGF